MRLARAVVWKEVHSFLHDWRMLVTAAVLPLAVSHFLTCSRLATEFTVNAALVSSSLIAAVLVATTLTWRSFSHDRDENELASMLGSPISVREIFVGKSLAVFLFGYPSMLIPVVATACGQYFRMGAFPDAPAFAMALLAVPVYALALVEVIGMLYFLIGNFYLMRYIAVAMAIAIFGIAVGSQEAMFDLRVILAVTVIGIAVAAVMLIVFTKVGKTRLAR